MTTIPISGALGVGAAPAGTPNAGTVYVAGNGAVSVVDPTNTVISTVTVGSGPNDGVAVAPAGTPNGGDVYVTNYGASPTTVSVIDPHTNTVIATIAPAHGPFAIAVSHTGANAGDVYVVNYGPNPPTVSVYDPTNTLVTRITVGNLPEAVAVGSP